MVVKSAAKVVSYTSSTPMSFRAVTSLSRAFTPAGRPKASPTATRTAGAICTTTRLDGSWMARQARPIWFFTVMAPVGHTAAHWPQLTHLVWASFRSKAGMTWALLPRNAKFRMPMPCISSHTRTQSPHRMHLLGSRSTAGEESSNSWGSRVSAKRTRRTPNCWARSCRWHWPLFSQVVHSQLWEASSSSRIIRRCFSRRPLLVRMRIPSRGSIEQLASIFPVFSSSTTHIRQAP